MSSEALAEGCDTLDTGDEKNPPGRWVWRLSHKTLACAYVNPPPFPLGPVSLVGPQVHNGAQWEGENALQRETDLAHSQNALSRAAAGR